MGRRRPACAGASTRSLLSTSPTGISSDDVAPYLRRLVLLVGAIILVDTMFFAAIGPLLPDYADRLDLSKAAAGFLSASYAIGALVGSLPAGWLAARWGGPAAGVVRLAGVRGSGGVL